MHTFYFTYFFMMTLKKYLSFNYGSVPVYCTFLYCIHLISFFCFNFNYWTWLCFVWLPCKGKPGFVVSNFGRSSAILPFTIHWSVPFHSICKKWINKHLLLVKLSQNLFALFGLEPDRFVLIYYMFLSISGLCESTSGNLSCYQCLKKTNEECGKETLLPCPPISDRCVTHFVKDGKLSQNSWLQATSVSRLSDPDSISRFCGKH